MKIFQRLKIKVGISIVMVLISLIVLLQGGVAVYNFYDSNAESAQMSSLLISKDMENLSELLSRIETLCKLMETDKDYIYTPASNVKNNIMKDAKHFKDLHEKFKNLVSHSIKNSSFVSAYLFLSDELPLAYIAPKMDMDLDHNLPIGSSDIYEVSNVENMEWFKKLNNSVESIIWVNKLNGRDTLCFAKKLSMWEVTGNNVTVNTLGIFYVAYDLTLLLKQFELMDIYPSSGITLLYDDEIIYETKGLEKQQENSIRHTFSAFPKFNIITTIPKKEINDSFNRQMILSIVAILLTLFLGIFVLAYISKAMLHPIAKISKHLLDNRNSEIKYDKLLSPEVWILYRNHNYMVEQNKNMTKEMQNSYYKMLQAQINPHFIYNVISSISAVSLMKGEYKIANTLSNLVEMLRYSISSPDDFVSIKEEIDLIKKFIEIQNFRYKDNICMEYIVPNEFETMKIPRLTLQPLVENSIFHNDSNPATSKITVKIKAEVINENFVVTVMDNNSVDPEFLNQHLLKEHENSIENRRGVGIYNINQRISVLYGKDYSLSYSSKGDWLCATVTIPRLT